jgi:hypothetical protein
VVAQNYGGATFVWNTAGLAPGIYNIDVSIRQTGFSNPHETFAVVSYTHSVAVACGAGNLVSDKDSPQAYGTTVTVTGSAWDARSQCFGSGCRRLAVPG